jgi:hypothetical protein
MPCNTPVVFLIFCRPDLTAQVFEAIRQAQPTKLLVVADGPRSEAEAQLCQQTRSVIDQIDWNCEVLKNYSDVNLGCRRRVSSGLDWAFSEVEEAIILEDDCLPHPLFFDFCEELLAKYRDDERVMHIGGTNILGEWESAYQSYHFSHYSGIWGWASWRRAWQHYDVDMKLWQMISKEEITKDILPYPRSIEFWTQIFQSVYDQEIDTWDYQWLFARWIQNGLGIIPEVNLISNIGFGADATHTTSESLLSRLETKKVNFPLKHPAFVTQNSTMDGLINQKRSHKSLKNYVKSLFSRFKVVSLF